MILLHIITFAISAAAKAVLIPVTEKEDFAFKDMEQFKWWVIIQLVVFASLLIKELVAIFRGKEKKRDADLAKLLQGQQNQALVNQRLETGLQNIMMALNHKTDSDKVVKIFREEMDHIERIRQSPPRK